MASITYQTPGVYVEEILNGARPIQAVGTRTAGFIGEAPYSNGQTKEAVVVNNWAEFVRRFATPPTSKLDDVSKAQDKLDKHRKDFGERVDKLTAEEKKDRTDLADKVATAGKGANKTTHLSDAVYGFFLNGGNRCYVVDIGPDGKVKDGLDLLEEIDEIAIVAAPGYTKPVEYEAIRTHCDSLKDRVGILDGPEIVDPQAMKQLAGEAPPANATWKRPDPSERGHVSLYVPWIEIGNSVGGNGSAPNTRLVPPSGHIAGIWARSDATRGVHKAPANEIVRGALGLQRQITNEDQGMLNQYGVNVIRYFPNEGFLVWGARTLIKDRTSAFRYLNVRRLFNMIEESIAESTRWIVFEPNDRPLWKAIRRDVTAFLMGFWRDGALMGRTPQEAFYVKCDEETNPIESIREGKVIIEVGLAPVLPAEFVIFRISQYEAGTEVELQS